MDLGIYTYQDSSLHLISYLVGVMELPFCHWYLSHLSFHGTWNYLDQMYCNQ